MKSKMESQVPFFSVVVPVYNKEKYVVNSINSIIKQTFKDFELIVICDPSTDNSSSEVEKIKDQRARVIHRAQPGPGGYAARNLGIKEAVGKWIAFLDADDEWYPQHLENMHSLIVRNEGVKVFTCSRVIIESGVKRLDYFSRKQDKVEEVFSFFDYLKLSRIYEHPFHPNTVVVENNKKAPLLEFPEGKVNRSGDLYAWVFLAHKVKKFVWTSHVGSVLNKDVVGVAMTSLPSIEINNEMVADLEGLCSPSEYRELKKYANKLILSAALERKKCKERFLHYVKYLYWSKDLYLCLKWSAILMLPINMYYCLRKVSRRMAK